jgi:CHAT domain-containing protein
MSMIRGTLWAVAVLHCLVMAGSLNAAPQPPGPPKLTEQQQQRLAERDRLQLRASGLVLHGKYDEARAAADKVVAIDREVFGPRQGQLAQALLFRAGIYADTEDFATARRDALEALALQQQAHPEAHWRIADARRMLARIQRLADLDPRRRQQLARAERDLAGYQLRQRDATQTFQLAEAIRLAEKALDFRRQLFGDHDPEYARGLSGVALLYRVENRSWPRAEYLLRHLVDISQETLGETHPELAASLTELGGFYLSKGGNGIKSRLLCEKAAAIYEKALGEDDIDYVARLTQLATLVHLWGDLGHAKPLLEKSLAIVRATRGERDGRYLRSLQLLFTVYRDRRAFAQAEPLAKQCLELNRQANGENSPAYYSALKQLAFLYRLRGTEALAEPLERQMGEVEQAIRQDKTRSLAQARRLRSLADMKGAQGSEPIYKEALAVYEEAVGKKHAEYISTLRSLASHYGAAEANQKEGLLLQALALQKETVGEGHPTYLRDLRDLTSWYLPRHEYKKAEALFQEALRVSQKALGEKDPTYGQALHDLANLYYIMGAYEKATPLYRRRLDFARETGGEQDFAYADALFSLAANYQQMGDAARADPLFQQFLDLCRERPGQVSPARSLFQVGRENWSRVMAWHLAHLADRAELVLHEWLTMDEEWLEESLSSQSENERIQVLTTRRRVLESYLSLATEAKPMPVERIWRHLLAWKGAAARPVEDRLARDRPELRDLVARLNQARARLAQLAYAAPPPAQQKEWVAQLGRLRNDKENLEGELVRRSDLFRRRQEQHHLGPADVVQALPADAAFVDFFEYTHSASTRGEGKVFSTEERRLLACLVGLDRKLACVRLREGEEITAAVRSWRQGGLAAQRDAAARLSQLLWKPLEPHLAGARTVLISPDGALVQLPLAVLPGRGKDSYLIEDVALGYVPSGRQLVEAFREPAGAPGHGLLAAGGIDYAADPGLVAAGVGAAVEPPRLEPRQRAGFRFLVGTELEARRCQELFHQAFPAEPATLLTHAAAQEGRFKAECDRHYRYLHLATHGFFESPRRIAALRADRPAREAGSPADLSGWHLTSPETPLLHCGVALAGAARASLPGDQSHEDGILTAEEVAGLDLRGTELVVLSACDTGLGMVEQGQGVLGLQRAFQAAGARALVASLWKVDDAATALLMEEFYTNLWKKKLPKLEALRQAQLTVLREPERVLQRRKQLREELAKLGQKRDLDTASPLPAGDGQPRRSPPLWWAGFVLSGDGR